MKSCIVLTEKQQKLYKKFDVKPDVVLGWLNREVIKLLEKGEDIYGILNNLDEVNVAEVIMEAGTFKKKERLKAQEHNRYMRKQEEKKKAKLGKTRRENEG